MTDGMDKPNILVVCGKNKRRSKTAECLFKNDSRINIRSVGLSTKSERKISEKDLIWASLILVMETDHRARIKELYRYMKLSKIIVLNIPDRYNFMDSELVELLTQGINSAIDDYL